MSSVNIFDYDSYKEVLKAQLKVKKQSDKKLTLRYLARHIDIQHTYLSKVFNREDIQLNEDHTYELSRLLGFDAQETEYIILLRTLQLSNSLVRKEELQKKISSFQQDYKVGPEIKNTNMLKNEMEYLFDPNFVLVHVCLSVDKYFQNPVLICDKLQIKINELKQYLKVLEELGFVVLGDSSLELVEVKSKKIHYGKSHPLMRVHQHILKGKINDALRKTKERDKESFMATFTFDDDSFALAKEEFKLFFNKVANMQGSSQGDKVYQLNFDLFKWL